MRPRNREAAERAAERRRRETEAPRLLSVVPNLTSLRLEVEERRADHALAETAHVKRVVVEHAPALFVLPCTDRSCKEGGHDVTSEVMRNLWDKRERFSGEDACSGSTGSAPCQRVLHYVAVAEFSAPSA